MLVIVTIIYSFITSQSYDFNYPFEHYFSELIKLYLYLLNILSFFMSGDRQTTDEMWLYVFAYDSPMKDLYIGTTT
jgi:hypothetical protein